MKGRAALTAVVVAASLVGASRPLHAREPEDAVLVTVVTDGEGVPVRGLRAGDFELLHDGKPVAPSRFLEVAGGGLDSARILRRGGSFVPRLPDAEPPEAQPERRLVLLFDEVAVPDRAARAELFDAARALVEDLLGERGSVMIVWADGSGHGVLPFTDDPGAIERALLAIEAVSGGPSVVPMRPSEAPGSGPSAPPSGHVRDAAGESVAGGGEPSVAQREWTRARTTTNVLRGLAAVLGALPGRRAIVFVAGRFPRLAGSRPAAPGAARQGLDTLPLLEEVADAANAEGVALYGLAPRPPGDEREALGALAGRTGGLAASGRSEVGPFFERVAIDLDSWYEIRYRPPPGRRSRASVLVRARNPLLRVRSRTACVTRTADEELGARTLAGLFARDPGETIPVRATARACAGLHEAGAHCLEVTLPAGSFPVRRSGDRLVGEVRVIVVAATPDGTIGELDRRRERLATSSTEGTTPAFSLRLDVGAPPPGTRLAVGVLDESGGRTGVGLATIPVPDP